MIFIRLLILMVALLTSALMPAAAAAATLVADLAPSSATTFASPDVTHGWQFHVRSGFVIPVDALGMWDANSDGLAEPNQIGLWDGTGTLLHSVTITNANSVPYPSATAGGRWLFTPIMARTLQPGMYTVGVHSAGGLDAPRTSLTEATRQQGVTFGVQALWATGFQLPNFGLSRVQNLFGANLSYGVVPEPTVPAGALVALLIFTRFRQRST